MITGRGRTGLFLERRIKLENYLKEKTMRTTLNDLNEILFESLERLTNEDLTDEQLDREIKRNEAVQKTAKTIIENGALALQAKKHLDEYGQGQNVVLPLLTSSVE